MNQPVRPARDGSDTSGKAGLPDPIAVGANPPALDDDDDVIDAEIVETPGVPPFPTAISPEADYTEAGVPSLGYLRDRIEGRYATAIGSSELAEAQAARQAALRAEAEEKAVVTAEQQRAAREKAAVDRLAEIRRSLHP